MSVAARIHGQLGQVSRGNGPWRWGSRAKHYKIKKNQTLKYYTGVLLPPCYPRPWLAQWGEWWDRSRQETDPCSTRWRTPAQVTAGPSRNQTARAKARVSQFDLQLHGFPTPDNPVTAMMRVMR